MRFREPLIIPCVCLMAGILSAHYTCFSSTELGVAAALLFSLGVVASWKAPRCVWIAWCCCVTIAGAALAEYKRPAPRPQFDAEPGETLLVAGCVVEPLSVRDGRARFSVEIAPGARVAVTMRADGEIPRLPYGSLVEVPARVRRPRNYGNPGAFDYEGYLARRHTYWNATVPTRMEVTRIGGGCGSQFAGAIHELRARAIARLDSLHQSDPAMAGLLRALLLGDDEQLRPDTSDEFRRTGTYHALVISGLHISLIAGSLLWILRRAFAPFWLRLVFSGIAAWAYTLIAGGDAPVLRAAIGFTLALIAMAVHRRVRVLNLLAAVAMMFLLVDPGQLFEASFQLSFAAVAAIGGLAGPIIERTAAVLATASRTIGFVRPSPAFSKAVQSLRVELRLLAQTVGSQRLVSIGGSFIAMCAEMVILSAAVQFALVVPSVVYFHRVPVTSLLANLVSVPALNGAVGFGLTSLLTGSTTLANATAVFARFAQWAVSWFASIEPNWRPPAPSPWLAIGFVLSLVLVAVALRTRSRATAPTALLSMGLAVWMCAYEAKPGEAGWLEVSAIDVGQGESLLVVFPEGQTLLVDGGGFPSFKGAVTRMDVGEQIVSPYLWSRGIRHLDMVAMTHAHDDHAQGLPAIIRNFHPAELWSGATPSTSTAPTIESAVRAGMRIWQPRAGEVRQFGKVFVRVLAPAVDYQPSATPKNNDSLVIEISYGRRRFLLTGDAERAVELNLVQAGLLREADVLKLGHHGSRTSTLPDLLEITRPFFAVISAGEGNLYNHPHPEVMERMHEFRVQAFRTDRAGLTRFRTDGYHLQVETNGSNWQAD